MDVRQVIPRDAIPSIDDPAFSDSYVFDPEDEVIVVEGSPPRAYAVRILDYHEIVNDVVDGRPIAVTWCPLCGSAIVFDRQVDERTLTFGVSGKLADDDLVLYDWETESEWKQSRGVAIDGPLRGSELEILPARLTTARRFEEDAPDGRFLAPPGTPSEAASDTDEPTAVEYDEAPYREYARGEGFGLEAHRGTGAGREWNRTDLAPKTVVLGLTQGGVARGYPRDRVQAAGGLVTDELGELPVVVVDDGDEINAYRDPGHDWSLTGGQLEADGTVWELATGRAADGRSLGRLPARRLLAFTWQDDHGPDAFWSPS